MQIATSDYIGCPLVFLETIQTLCQNKDILCCGIKRENFIGEKHSGLKVLSKDEAISDLTQVLDQIDHDRGVAGQIRHSTSGWHRVVGNLELMVSVIKHPECEFQNLKFRY